MSNSGNLEGIYPHPETRPALIIVPSSSSVQQRRLLFLTSYRKQSIVFIHRPTRFPITNVLLQLTSDIATCLKNVTSNNRCRCWHNGEFRYSQLLRTVINNFKINTSRSPVDGCQIILNAENQLQAADMSSQKQGKSILAYRKARRCDQRYSICI